jgi:TetR/AcrR family transcriptional regulator, regulator of mycofactocin system
MALGVKVKRAGEDWVREQADREAGVPNRAGRTGRRAGRRPVTSREQLERVALELFSTAGFDEVSVEDIAAAAGTGRRTVFRYFPSKNDMVWGDFDRELDRFRDWFATCPEEEPLMDAIRRGVVAFNAFPADVEPMHRRRMALILNTPALQAHSTLRYAEWRAIITDFAARRSSLPTDHLLPRLVGHTALGASVAAYEQWLQDEEGDLGKMLDRSLRTLASGLGSLAEPRR